MRVHASTLPLEQALPAIDLTAQGNVTAVSIRAFGAGRVPATAAQRMADAAEAEIRAVLGDGVDRIVKEAVHEPPEGAVADGAGILMVADTDSGCVLGASAKGERGTSAEATGSMCAADLWSTIRSGACVDEHMQDQLVIFMALAQGTSRMLCGEPSLHARTAMVIAETLLRSHGVKFTVTPSNAGRKLFLVECKGAGLTRQALHHSR